ncbi:MAG: hypothetical protein HYR55_03710 [Acidobacteria bacterium]|nr:hypothetical protein [Acidobacteriota bacterium]MBI3656076.1 hypothetical protein [Acidobacteriota bacterium]
MFQAHQLARKALEDVAKALPPLLRDFRLSRAGFTRTQGTTITFKALENRTQNVPISLKVVQLDPDNIPIEGTEQSIVARGETWDRLSRQLVATPAADLTRLPWENTFSITWNGQVVGAPLEECVEYALWLWSMPYG